MGSEHMDPLRPATLNLLPWQEPEAELNKLFLMKVFGRDRNVKVKMFGCVEVIVSFCSN